MIEIKSLSGEVIASYDVESVKEAVEKAVFEKKDLRGADLSNANLRGSYLSNANLRGSYLSNANLRGSYLSNADLRGAYLSNADIRYSNLRYSDLRYSDLRGSDLRGSDLRYANLRGSDLRSAEMEYSDTDKRYIQIGLIGSCKRKTTYCMDDDIVWCGCFTGTLAEFEEKVKVTHADNKQYLAEYMGAINYFKSLKDQGI